MGRSRPPINVDRLARGGFTLIEVLISVVVLSVGIVIVLQAMHTALHVWDGAVEQLRGTMLAREIIEKQRLDIHQSGSVPTPSSGRFPVPFDRYQWQTAVVAVDAPELREALRGEGDGEDSLFSLSCRVQRENSTRDVTLSTLVYLPPEKEDE